MSEPSAQRPLVGALPWPEGARRAVRAWREWRRRRETERFERSLAGPKILRSFDSVHPDAFFVEIGANDGEQHDHLRPFLQAGRWRGIMVEPVPYVFERLQANYGDLPGITLENVAIADRDGDLPFYHLQRVEDRAAAGLPQWYDGIGSFSREAVLGHAALVPGLEGRLTCVNVPCLTFDSLCDRHGVDRVDLILVDTEGYDYELLRTIDWDRHRPRLVIFEHYHLAAVQRRTLREMFGGRGYEIKEEGFDTWCVDARIQDPLTDTFRRVTPGLPAQSVTEDR
jgi:FkbM family methyltransferase